MDAVQLASRNASLDCHHGKYERPQTQDFDTLPLKDHLTVQKIPMKHQPDTVVRNRQSQDVRMLFNSQVMDIQALGQENPPPNPADLVLTHLFQKPASSL